MNMPSTTSTVPGSGWSAQQLEALDAVRAWMRDPMADRVFFLAGYAGTGKTTLARYFAEMIGGLVLFAAFTGKAASVLRRKGCPEARTLHSILYDVADADRSRLRELVAEKSDADRKIALIKESGKTESIELDFLTNRAHYLEREIAQERERTRGPRFALNPNSIMKDASLLILDECSMVDKRLGEDALSFGKRILVIGDPAQLPPVYGQGYFTSNEPDFLLTEIHRQAHDNPIVRAATAIRERRMVPYGDWGAIRHLRRSEIDGHTFATECARRGSMILCGKNETRRAINRAVRHYLGFKSPLPENGEPLVVLRNDHELGVLNGVVCRSLAAPDYDAFDDSYMIELEYEGRRLLPTPMDPVPFRMYWNKKLGEDWSPSSNRHLLALDWAYAITVHKSQGSEWEDVTLWDDAFGRGDLRWQWLYTAVTRASERLTIVSGAP